LNCAVDGIVNLVTLNADCSPLEMIEMIELIEMIEAIQTFQMT